MLRSAPSPCLRRSPGKLGSRPQVARFVPSGSSRAPARLWPPVHPVTAAPSPERPKIPEGRAVHASTSLGPRSPKPVSFPSLSPDPLDGAGDYCPQGASPLPQATTPPGTVEASADGSMAVLGCQRPRGGAGQPRRPYPAVTTRQRWPRGRVGRPPLPHLTSNTSSSRIRVPNTMMPLTSITGWSLRSRGLVVFFLQSRIKVTFFLWMLRAILCHLQRNRQPSG